MVAAEGYISELIRFPNKQSLNWTKAPSRRKVKTSEVPSEEPLLGEEGSEVPHEEPFGNLTRARYRAKSHLPGKEVRYRTRSRY